MCKNLIQTLESRTLFSGHLDVTAHVGHVETETQVNAELETVTTHGSKFAGHTKAAVNGLKGEVKAVLNAVKHVKVGTLATALQADLTKVQADAAAIQTTTGQYVTTLTADFKAFIAAKTADAKTAAKQQLATDEDKLKAAVKPLTDALKADLAKLKTDAQAIRAAAKKAHDHGAMDASADLGDDTADASATVTADNAALAASIGNA